MYTAQNGEKVFVVDGHIHLWDGSPENWRNRYGKGWIECFYDYHKSLSPQEYVWPIERFQKYGLDQAVKDLFEEGYVDVGIFQSVYLTEFFKNGFNTLEQNYVAKEAYPDRFIVNGGVDPRDGERALEYLRMLKDKYDIQGIKLTRPSGGETPRDTVSTIRMRFAFWRNAPSSGFETSTLIRALRFGRLTRMRLTFTMWTRRPPSFLSSTLS